MTVKMILFLFIIVIWFSIGIIGVINCKKNRIHFEMLIFLFFVPFIPLIAKWCGLL